ncbi:hypothetical protein D3C76_1790770 [compost metagenome]
MTLQINRTGTQHSRIRCEGARDQGRVSQGRNANCDIDSEPDNIHDAVRQCQINAQRRVFCQERGNQRHDH